MTVKGHLGMTPDLLPSQRGFERTVIMADTGADNFEKKTYSPLNAKANWFADGKALDDLPEDFYSSKYHVDKAVEFIESNRGDGKPFFSYIAFQAVHTPVQAPREYTDKYMGKYDAGWQKLRESRLQRAKDRKIVPSGTKMVKMGTSVDWDSLSETERQYESKKMAVYAGMVDAMDHHIGRFITYLEETGQYDNTVFIFTSDNGPACTDVDSNKVAWERLYLKLWMKANGYNRDYETLGTRGSYINMGMTFASSAAAPLAYFKFWVGEGGMRVPLIISGKGIPEKGKMTNAFTYVTDITPTILDIAGVTPHQGKYRGRQVEPMIGKSLLPLAIGEADRVYYEDETVGYELTGHAALFKGDYKIVRNRGPVGDDAWHLFNIVDDPGETTDLKAKMPDRFADMMADYRSYVVDNNVLPVPEDYEYFNALRSYATRGQLKAHWPGYAVSGVVIIGLVSFFGTRRFRKK
jgi:arylsulfatase A-like enzyme